MAVARQNADGFKVVYVYFIKKSNKIRNKKGEYECKTLANANVLTQIY